MFVGGRFTGLRRGGLRTCEFDFSYLSLVVLGVLFGME